MLIEIFIAGLVQDVLLIVTNRYSTLWCVYYTFVSGRILYLLPFIAAIYMRYRHCFRRPFSRVAVLCLILYLAVLPTAIMQIVFDVAEVEEIKRKVYWPWNYLWAETDPLVARLWIIWLVGTSSYRGP